MVWMAAHVQLVTSGPIQGSGCYDSAMLGNKCFFSETMLPSGKSDTLSGILSVGLKRELQVTRSMHQKVHTLNTVQSRVTHIAVIKL